MKKTKKQKPVEEESVVLAEEEQPPQHSDDGILHLSDIRYSEPGEVTTHRLSPLRLKQLAVIGIDDPVQLAVANPEDIMNTCGIARDIATAYIIAAKTELEQHDMIRKSITTAKEELERRQKLLYLTTGSAKFDELLKGGIESGSVTEVYGQFGAGKTQLCHTLAVNAQLPIDKKGLDGKVLWIDSENTVRPERLRDIAAARGLDQEQVLKNVIIEKQRTAADLEYFVSFKIGKSIRDNKIKLVILDSIINLHRNEFGGRGNLAERQHRLGMIIYKLVKLAEVYSIPVVFTNQIQTSPDSGIFGNPDKPTGGNVIAHLSGIRLALYKASGNERVIKIIDSPMHAFSDARIAITKSGVVDVDSE